MSIAIRFVWGTTPFWCECLDACNGNIIFNLSASRTVAGSVESLSLERNSKFVYFVIFGMILFSNCRANYKNDDLEGIFTTFQCSLSLLKQKQLITTETAGVLPTFSSVSPPQTLAQVLPGAEIRSGLNLLQIRAETASVPLTSPPVSSLSTRWSPFGGRR